MIVRYCCIVLLALILSGCGASVAGSNTPVPPPTPTVAPTFTPAPTPLPTATPVPTHTPAPTATSIPTQTPVPTQTPMPTHTPTPLPIGAYLAYVVEPGDTLARIAADSGSDPELIRRYNLLAGEPPAGRALILPQLAGASGMLASQRLIVSRGSAAKPWVALTLDAGGKPTGVEQVLQTLRERSVRITFFLTGAFIRDNPDLVRLMVADGHEIANHTFNHPDLRNRGADYIREELHSTDELMLATAGIGTRPFFRPPYGAYDKQVLEEVIANGYLPVGWTLDSLDSVGEPKTPEFLLERVTGKLPPEQLAGAIILAHCGFQSTADALPLILDRLDQMGFEVRTLSEVLGNGSQ